MTNIPIESDEAKAFVRVVELLRLRIHKIKQENTIHPRNGGSAWGFIAKEKALGWRKGVSDYLVQIPAAMSKDGNARTLFVELKRRRRVLKNGTLGKSPSEIKPEQVEFLDALNETGFVEGGIFFGSEEAEDFVKSFLK